MKVGSLSIRNLRSSQQKKKDHPHGEANLNELANKLAGELRDSMYNTIPVNDK